MASRARLTGALVGIASLVVLAGGAHAQVFYSFPGAHPVTDSAVALGLVSGFGDNVVRLGGFGRFNLSSSADLGLEVMWDNVDAENTSGDTDFWGAGLDGKYLIVSADGDMPLDIAVQAGGGFESRSDYLNIHVPFGGLASHDFMMNDGRRITPYGGVYFVYDHVKIDYADGTDASDSDFDVEMRVGASAEIVKRGSLFAALHAGNGTMFFLGFNTGF
ncbi:MAG TPA: hypothetical protein VF247_10895 [Candidatus Krumholzibacteria bacterium]